MNDSRELVLETEYWKAYVMPDQRYLGRMVVPLKASRRHLAELSAEEFQDFRVVVRILECAVIRALGATHFNWACLMNNAYQEDNPQPHVHWHVRPRYQTPPVFMRAEYPDPNFGHHYLREEGDKVFAPPEFRFALAERLRKEVDIIQLYEFK